MTAKFKADFDKWLTENYRPLELEETVREFWREARTKERLMEFLIVHGRGVSGWVEGPPTLNGTPHVGHMRGRAMKDLRYRWKTMQGYYVPFWAGWDCQGLPVELEVERRLGAKNKRELLERVGEEQFIEECKKVIMKYHEKWVEADEKLGVFMDQEKAYWTYHDEYIEREWQYLKKAWNQHLLEEGHYVVAYCPGCQTSLSSAEVGYEGSYQQVRDPSLHFKFKVADSQNEYFLVWTTMPFTLVTDTLLAVRPESKYARVRVHGEKWILARQRVEVTMKELLIEDFEVEETFKGEDLKNLKYEYPFKDIIPKQAEMDTHLLVHTVVCEDFVDVNTGTGIVHLAPGNGEEDFLVAKKLGVPVFAPFDDEINFTAEAGVFKGVFARDADQMVVEELRKRALLVSVKSIEHEYPTCWRSHHKLVWVARREYFLRTDRINDRVMEAAKKVEYFFEGSKNRFLSFLRERKPWCISRERVWGTPLPIWSCKKCGAKEIISSRKELMEKAAQRPPSDLELHKPWIDRIKIVCPKCKSSMEREPFVLDTWHNSGASPYARFTDEEFRKYVPFDFLTEAVDQTRGWANSLLLEHIILEGKPEAPYLAFLFQGLVQDRKGRKMSKSEGNMIEANELLEKQSADVCRFYMLRKCSPVESMNFDVEELRRRPYQVLSTLYHLSKFLMQNAEYDNFNPEVYTIEWARKERQLERADLWLISKLQETIERCTDKLEKCEFNIVLAALEDFVIDTASRLYVPMIRKELWTDDPEALHRRLAIYAVLWYVLRRLTLLFNPVTPFLAEALHQGVYRRLDKSLSDSVNFEEWPKPNKKMRNSALEQDFENLFCLISLVYAARQTASVKRRWPLQKAVIVASETVCESLKELKEAFLELSNVKSVGYAKTTPSYVSSKRWNSASEGGIQVFVDTHRDMELLGEGLMRDLARRIQSLRKECGYIPTDILNAVHVAELGSEDVDLLKPFLGQMRELIRAKKIQLHDKHDNLEAKWHKYQLDSKTLYIAISD